MRSNALVWSVDPFSYMETYTLWYPSIAETRNSVANRSGMISNELYRLMAKKYLCSFSGVMWTCWESPKLPKSNEDNQEVWDVGLSPTRVW